MNKRSQFVTCWRCGDGRDCPMHGPNYARRCWGCGEPGHVLRDCPLHGPNYDHGGNQAPSNDPSKRDAAIKTRTKLSNTSAEISTNSEPTTKPVYNNNLSPNIVNVFSTLLEQIKLRDKEIEDLENIVSTTTIDLASSQTKNKELSLNMNTLQVDLEKCEKDLSYFRDMYKEMKRRWWDSKNEFVKSKDEWNGKIQLRDKEIEDLKSILTTTTIELASSQTKNKELSLNMNTLQVDLEKCKKDLSYFRDMYKEMKRRWWDSKNEFVKSKDEWNGKIQLRDKEIEDLKSILTTTTIELASSQTKNKELSLNMNTLQVDLEKCKKYLSCFKDEYEELKKRWSDLNKDFVESINELNGIQELEEANESAKWRKTAKAIASVFVGDAEICSKTTDLESLVLYYSNRADKRMSNGKMRKALYDCRMATRLDPGFLRARLTTGKCHLVFGEIGDAMYNFKSCLDSQMVYLDRRLIIDASDGLQNAERVVHCINRSAELLEQKTYESATNALEVITEALSISCYSETLLEMKGEALFMLHKYEEVVQMCEQTLCIAEMNDSIVADRNHMSFDEQIRPLKIWRFSLMCRSYFRMAKFDLALAILEKYEQLAPSETATHGLSSLSPAVIRELFHCKSAGNEAFQAGKYREAMEYYSKAIMRSIESRYFTAIVLCNRAAALEALGEVIDAIGDCNLAIALDRDYIKAFTRRANLHEKIRDYVQASLDFKKLIFLLEKRSEKKYVEHLVVARQRLSSIKRNMKKGMPMNLYLILGLKGSDSGSKVKKAYHKAALRHHPDKAGKFLTISYTGADCHDWKEIFVTIQKDAEKLFKSIGEAYFVLSDTDKRAKYNLEESTKDDFKV